MLTFLVFLSYDQGCKAVFSLLNVFLGDIRLPAAQLLGTFCVRSPGFYENVCIDSAIQVLSSLDPKPVPFPSQCSQDPGSSE